MRRGLRAVATGSLAFLAAALVVGIVLLRLWGRRIEAIMMVFGDRVWVTFDAGDSRVLLLLIIPGVLLGTAFLLHKRRPSE